MTTTYTSLLGLALPVTGELSGTWGDTVNNSITSLLDSAIAGTTTLSVDADVTLTTTTGAANTSREAILLWTAGGTVTRTITAPAQSKVYVVINASSSTQSIKLVGAGPTTGVTIVQGEAAVCAWNGSDFIKVSNISGSGSFTNLSYTGTLTGGTGVVNLGSGQFYKDASGNVGIGTSSPSYPLTVVAASSGVGLAIYGRSSDNLAGTYWFSNTGVTQYGAITASASEYRIASTPAAAVQTFYTNGSERMRIDSSGKLLIGTSSSITTNNGESPYTQTSGTDSRWAYQVATFANSSGTQGGLYLAKSRGTSVGSYTAVQSGDSLGRIGWSGADGTNMSSQAAEITAQVDAAVSTGIVPGRLQFFTSNTSGTLTERMRIDSSGRVLINKQSTDGGQLNVQNSSTTTRAYVNATLRNSRSASTHYSVVSWNGSSTADAWIGQVPNTDALCFGFDAGTTIVESMRIDTNGNVGIGTSSPSAFGGVTLQVQNSNVGAILWSDGTRTGELLASVAAGVTIGSRTNHALQFSVNDTEKMRIDTSGYLLVGYTTSNGAYKLQVNSQIFATSATIATSDGRYKKDIQSLDGALKLVNQLNPVQFSWKQHPVHDFDTSTPTIGFIAQEVQQVLADKPYLNSIIKANECVIQPEEKDADGNVTKQAMTEEFLGIAEGNMIALLTKAIQEQQAIITSLTARIAALEAK